MDVYTYVKENAVRGDCECGRCIDAPSVSAQPEGHTIDMAFFKVAAKEEADEDTFRKLVTVEYPHWLDGQEHSYIQMGAEIGDQGLAMMTIALGHLLGVWKAYTPAMLGVPHDLQIIMAGQGLLSMKVEKEKTNEPN